MSITLLRRLRRQPPSRGGAVVPTLQLAPLIHVVETDRFRTPCAYVRAGGDLLALGVSVRA
jgi:hypothetical protein